MSTTEDRIIQVYEIGYSILPSVPEDSLDAVVAKIKSAIAAEEGVEIDSENPSRMPLAYEMSKTIGARKYVANEAFLGWIKFEAEPSRVLKIKGAVEKIDELLRMLLIKAPRETVFTFESARKALEEEEVETEEDAPLEEAAKPEVATEEKPEGESVVE